MKLIKSKQSGLKVKRSSNPKINLHFKDKPIKVSDEVGLKLLEDSNFEEVNIKKKNKKEMI